MTPHTPDAPAHVPWTDRILRVLDHIRAQLDTDLAPDDLATMAGFSLHHFHRVFRGMVGQSVMEYVRDQRLEQAAFRLKFGERPVTQVAFDAGYGSHEAFTRAFKARFEVTPSGYRESARAQRDAAISISVRHEAEVPVVCWRRTGAYDGSADAWNGLLQLAASQSLFGAHTRLLGFVHDDPEIVPTERLRYDAVLTLTREQESQLRGIGLPDAARVSVLPGGRYAVALHVGPYEDSDATYVSLLGHALPSRGVDITGDPVVEVYLNSPADTVPAELRTEILVRLV